MLGASCGPQEGGEAAAVADGVDGPQEDGAAAGDGSVSADAFSVTPPYQTRPLQVDGRFLRAADGAAVFLRGINVSNAAKYEPLHVGGASAEGMAEIARLGFNSVRLLTFWGAVMTAPEGAGVQLLEEDPEYLARLDAMIARASAAGLMVVLDMHQDVFGWGLSGNGAPPAGCDPKHTEGFTPVKPWFANYLSPAVKACFDDLYTDTPYRAAFVEAWRILAARYEGDERIVAFDLINEPHQGTYPIAEAMPERLFPFYRVVIDAIRHEDPRRFIFVEPVTALLLSDELKVGPVGRRGLGWAPHYYHVLAHEGMAYDVKTREKLLDAPIDRHAAAGVEAVGQGAAPGPVWFGEFGAPPSGNVVQLAHHTLDAFDRHMAGWAMWSYDKGGFGLRTSKGALRLDYMRAILRPHVRRLPGEPLGMAWDQQTRTLTVRYRTGPDDKAEAVFWAGLTEARANGDGGDAPKVTLWSSDPDGTWSHGQQGAVVTVKHDPGTATHTVKLIVAPPQG